MTQELSAISHEPSASDHGLEPLAVGYHLRNHAERAIGSIGENPPEIRLAGGQIDVVGGNVAYLLVEHVLIHFPDVVVSAHNKLIVHDIGYSTPLEIHRAATHRHTVDRRDQCGGTYSRVTLEPLAVGDHLRE